MPGLAVTGSAGSRVSLTPFGVNPTGSSPPSGPYWPKRCPGTGCNIPALVSGSTSTSSAIAQLVVRKARCQRRDVRLGGGVDGVALRGALGHRAHLEHHHDDRHHQQRRRRQHPVAAGVGDLGVPRVVHPEVQPAREQTRQDRQREEDRHHRDPGDHRLLVEPRHAVVADVEPAVDTRCRPSQYEQQRGHVQRQVPPAVQARPGRRRTR